ncbi:hypothetical protein RRG08_051681 [Elysia crispata]|uniref:Sodium-dependent multivitamin transporter n=1 Tax=Elysia crispata TaxID=231223 RepID=A0AAE1AFJ3_9GAST|nr:hypothetical protein RRG08_051681 [Elysia crispata]
MGAWPGLPGLFVAAIFIAFISTVSSGVNSLAAVILEDVVKPLYRWRDTELTRQAVYRATVPLGIMFGGLTIGLAYMVDRLGETAFLISINLFGMVGGPVVGVIINGIFLPFVNSWGAGAGLVTSLTVGLYIGTEPLLNPPPSFNLPMRTDGCWRDNVTSQMSDVGNTSAPLPALGLPGNLTAG